MEKVQMKGLPVILALVQTLLEFSIIATLLDDKRIELNIRLKPFFCNRLLKTTIVWQKHS